MSEFVSAPKTFSLEQFPSRVASLGLLALSVTESKDSFQSQVSMKILGTLEGNNTVSTAIHK